MKKNYTSQQYVYEQIIPNKKFLARAADNLRSLSPGARKILSIFRNMGTYKKLYFRQTWLAEATGLCRAQVNRIIKKLDEMGLIAKKYRHMNTSNYRVSDFLINPPAKLKKLLTLICIFSVGMLKSQTCKPSVNKHVTHTLRKILGSNSNTKFNNYIYIKYSINGRSTAHSMSQFNKEDFIPPIVSSLKFLDLTWDQKFKLASFPTNALSHAFTRLKYGNGTQNSYAWFKYLCEEYCLQQNIKPNWRLYYQLQEVYGTTSEKKEEKPAVKMIVAPRVTYSYKLPESYLSLRTENPIYIFNKQYRFMLTQVNSVIPQHALWELGVANFVRASFFGYLNDKNPAPDSVLAHIDSLVDSVTYREIVNEFGLAVAKKFIELCLDSVFEEQRYALNRLKVSHYGKIKEIKKVDLTEHVMYRTKNLDEFLRSDSYVYLSQVVGEDLMKKYVYDMLSNWMKIMQ